MKPARLTLLIVLITPLFSLPLRAAIPGGNNREAYTQHKYLNDLLEYNLRTTVDAYKQAGQRNPKWDAPAIALLEGISRYMTNARDSMIYGMKDVPMSSELEKLGRQAIDAGCTDPLVLDMFSITLTDQKRIDEVAPILRKAAEGLMNSHYAAFRAANSARRILKHLRPTDGVERAKLDDRVYSLDIAAAQQALQLRFDRRVYLNTIRNDLASWSVERQQAFYANLKSVQAEPWLTNMVGGIYHIKAAWEARGDGYANTVTNAGWKKMDEELTLARGCLQEAYRLEPKYPEAATEMISVAMGQSPEQLRTWFDRAVTAQFDFPQAYSNYIYAIYPRWHGSHEMMLAFAHECVDTGRFDTEVPLTLLKVLENIFADTNGDWSTWRQPGTLEAARDVLARYADSVPLQESRQHFYSEIVGFAWQVGRYDVGRTALDKIDGKYRPGGLDYAKAIPSRTVSGTYALTGAHAQALLQAEKAIAAEQFDAGITTLKSVLDQIKPEDNEEIWIRGRIQEIMWQKEFETGRVVNLIPQHNQIWGLYTQRGSFSSDGGIITATTDNTGARLACGARFGQRWELRGTIEVLPGEDGKIAQGAGAGIFFGSPDESDYYGLQVRPASAQYVFHRPETSDGIGKQSTRPSIQFAIRYWEGNAEIRLNNATFMEYGELEDIARRATNRFGVYSAGSPSGTKFRVSNLGIQLLKEEPNH